MTRRRVWAPSADRVDLVSEGWRLPLTRRAGGWHEVELSPAEAVADYWYSLDGGPPMADPRSPWQPSGVTGPTRPVDHAAVAWHDDGWRGRPLASAVLYELHVGTFTPAGTFAGIVDRLDHLLDLGVTAIELMPVAEFPGRRGWGYDGVFPFAPHHAYGGPQGLKEMVDACHRRGMAVVMDVVYNHLGPSGNVLPAYGPYLTDRYRTPWGQAVNFDGPGSDEVRRYVLDNALMWLRDYHLDGLRLDAVHAIYDASAVPILEQLSVEVEALSAHLGRTLWLIAESDRNDPRVVRRREVGGDGLDALWDDDFHHALHALLTGERDGYYEDFGRWADLATALRERFVYAGRYSPHRGRVHGRPAGDVPGWRFIGYAQNHDQIGNRARGERSSALMSAGRLRVAAALVCCAPFVPMLFQGEEWGATTPFRYFTDHAEPELAHAVTEGRRREFAAFGWRPEDVPDPQDEQTWSVSRLSWAEAEQPANAGLLRWYRELLALRAAEADLIDGRCDEVIVDEEAGLLRMQRGGIWLFANLGPATTLSDVVSGTGTVLLARSDPGIGLGPGGLVLPPESVAVVRRARTPVPAG